MRKNIKFNIVYLFIFTLLFNPNLYSWGEKGHSLIGKMSVKYLPKGMNDYMAFGPYIEQHSPDPDNRKRDDKTEAPKHFIDIDFYKEFNIGKMTFNKDSLKNYSDSVILSQGILPWATMDTYSKLVKALKEKNKEKVLLYMSDLSHYVGDGHQPMHTVTNYNGQLTGQKGLHARYEITMVDAHINEIENAFKYKAVDYIKDKSSFILEYISNANIFNNIILNADLEAFKYSQSRENSEYYRLLWFRTGYITKLQITEAAYDLACLYYSAWVDAGKPACKFLK